MVAIVYSQQKQLQQPFVSPWVSHQSIEKLLPLQFLSQPCSLFHDVKLHGGLFAVEQPGEGCSSSWQSLPFSLPLALRVYLPSRVFLYLRTSTRELEHTAENSRLKNHSIRSHVSDFLPSCLRKMSLTESCRGGNVSTAKSSNQHWGYQTGQTYLFLISSVGIIEKMQAFVRETSK